MKNPARTLKSKQKSIHPADARDHARIAAATKFAVHLRLSPFEIIRDERDTLREARALAIDLAMQHSRFGRRAGIYALSPGGAATFVPANYPAE